MINSAKNSLISNRSILFVILGVAIVLRFFNYFNIPFTHDEFSALFRLEFDTIGELIEKGIKIDGHPAGVQLFLYFWTSVFGTAEWVVKLPFTLMGVGVVYLVYLIGKKWRNETVGLVAAAFIASSQYMVMYSQIARPYMSGLFFSMLLVLFWTNLILTPTTNFRRNAIGFVMAGTLCAYNHHFSLLFAGLVGVFGLFLIKKDMLKHYITMGVVIFILYTPHLPIFFNQLGMGGVEGWLAKPEPSVFYQYFWYTLSYSYYVLTVVFVLFFASVRYGLLNPINRRPKMLFIMFCLLILPLIIAYVYSIKVSAVLQYSVLIFSFPLFYLVVFWFLKEHRAKVNFLIVAVVLTVNAFALIQERNHYTLFYQSPYKQVVDDMKTVIENNHEVIVLITEKTRKVEYYLNKHEDQEIYWLNEFSTRGDIDDFIKSISEKYNELYLGEMAYGHPTIVPIIQHYYPSIEMKNDYVGATTYVFSNKGKKEGSVSLLNFEKENNDWKGVNESNIILDSIDNNHFYQMTEDDLYGPSFEIDLSTLNLAKNDFLDVQLRAKGNDITEVVIVCTININGREVFWGGNSFKEYVGSKKSHSWVWGYFSLKIADAKEDLRMGVMKVYIWNKNKNTFIIDDLQVYKREGNDVLYGLIE